MLMYPDGQLTFFGILVVAASVVYAIAVIVLVFKLINFCDEFKEVLMIMRRQAGVREYEGKLVPIDEDGNIKNGTK